MNSHAKIFVRLSLLACALLLSACGTRGALTLPPKALAPAQTKAAPPKADKAQVAKPAVDDSSAPAPTTAPATQPAATPTTPQ